MLAKSWNGNEHKKTEVMLISKKNERVGDETLKRIDYFKNLGCTISWDCRHDKKATIRSPQAKAAFQQLRGILCNEKLSFQCRYRLLKCYVYPIYTYCSEIIQYFDFSFKLEFFHFYCFGFESRVIGCKISFFFIFNLLCGDVIEQLLFWWHYPLTKAKDCYKKPKISIFL